MQEPLRRKSKSYVVTSEQIQESCDLLWSSGGISDSSAAAAKHNTT